MKFSEMMELAKAGYKPSEIKEMHDLESIADKEKDKEPEKEPEKETEKETEKEPEKETEKEPEKEPDKEPEKEPEKEPDKDINYKAKFEETEAKLKKLQEKNRHQNADSGDKESAFDIVAEAVRSFM